MTNGGGAATNTGTEYQNSVAAWIAIRIIGEKDCSPPWDVPAETTLEFLRCETNQPVDDLLVGLSNGGYVFAQVKHNLTQGRTVDCELALCLDQFVRQFIGNSTPKKNTDPWERPLNVNIDRLVIITNSGSSAPIREHTSSLLKKVRSLSPNQPLEAAADNQEKKTSLEILKEHIKRSWNKVSSIDPTDIEIRNLLNLIRIHILDVDDGETDQLQGKDILRRAILEHPEQADLAWNSLVAACTSCSSNRTGVDRTALQNYLLKQGISIKPARSFNGDIEKLKAYSTFTIDHLFDLSRIEVDPNTTIKIVRQSVQEVITAANKGSLLLVGEPGSGKSGLLYDVVQNLINNNYDVICLACDVVHATSTLELSQEMGIKHSFLEVLSNWPGTKTGYLVIDAFDKTIPDSSEKILLNLISEVIKSQSRWKVVTSIRKYDLKYHQRLREIFKGQPITNNFDKDLANVCHYEVPELSDDEINQINEPEELRKFINNSNQESKKLLRNIFNLRLLGELINLGITNIELSPILTQIDLLDKYWKVRILDQERIRYIGNSILKTIVEKMIETRSLYVSILAIVDNSDKNQVVINLLKTHVLKEAGNESDLAFSHNILFDYAVERLLLRNGNNIQTIKKLEANPDLIMIFRPSVRLHFQHLWVSDKNDKTHKNFWDFVFNAQYSKTLCESGKRCGPSEAAKMIRTLSDCEILFTSLENKISEYRVAVEQSALSLIEAVDFLIDNSKFFDISPWFDITELISQHLNPTLADAMSKLLIKLCAIPRD